jgi:ATP-binding cassette subfamily C protein
MELIAGKRYPLDDSAGFIKVVAGKIEAYAVTANKASFRQSFLMNIEAGQAAFPAIDNKRIKVIIYAVEDSEVEEVRFDSQSVDNLKHQMELWLKNLTDVPWLSTLADHGDDVLLSWRKGNLFEKCNTVEELVKSFADNEQIFAMLLGVHFKSEDKRLSRRIQTKELNKKLILENSINNLLGEESIIVEKTGEKRNSKTEESIFIVRSVAKAFNMPVDNITISENMVKKLDAIGVLNRLIQKGNMQTRFITLPSEWYKKDIGVMIGYYGENKELAAFIPVSSSSYKMITVQQPNGVRITRKIAKDIGTDAFACYAGFQPKPLDVFELFKFMLLQCWKADYFTVLLVSVFAGLIPLVTPIITETIFQDIIPIFDRQGLATVTQVLMVTAFTVSALTLVRSIAVIRISTKVQITSEAALWGRLMSLPTKFFRRFTVGELASRMSGFDSVKELVSGDFIGTLFGFVFSFWSIFLMCYYSFMLTFAAIGVWLVYFLIISIFYYQTLNIQRKLVASSNKTSGTVQQIFAGLAKFRVQGAEEQAYQLWSKDFGEQWKWNYKLRWMDNYTTIISNIQPFILTMILYYIAILGMDGADGKTGSAIGYPQFIAFSAAFTAFNASFGSAIGFIIQLFRIQPHIENLKPILEEIPENTADKADASVLSGNIEVSHLSFAYEEGNDVLHDVSFKIMPGENIAIVGRSGCGKSTLIRLLLGFEQPKQGAIYYDGQDLSDVSLSSVRSQMGVVLQNGQLMTGDIFTNIVGTRLLSQEEAWEAAEAAGIAEDIANMPMGMQTVISEGSSNISGGQRQRILIARALVNKPSILIFDEATSALDNHSQSIVTQSLDKLNATRIIVAHRLSTIRNCDRIIVMDSGRIVEVGSFDELVAQGGIFSELVKRQVV